MTRPRAARMITYGQKGKLFALYRDLGVTDRTERLADLSRYTHREVATTNDLTLDEAKMVIDYLERRAVLAGVE